MPCETLAARALRQVHPSGCIAVLASQCPWKSHLFEVESERPDAPRVVYALYQDTSGSWCGVRGGVGLSACVIVSGWVGWCVGGLWGLCFFLFLLCVACFCHRRVATLELVPAMTLCLLRDPMPGGACAAAGGCRVCPWRSRPLNAARPSPRCAVCVALAAVVLQ
jgi:hypothetical protein